MNAPNATQVSHESLKANLATLSLQVEAIIGVALEL